MEGALSPPPDDPAATGTSRRVPRTPYCRYVSKSRRCVGIALAAVLGALAPAVATASTNTVGGCPLFPADGPWNTRVDGLPVDPRSDEYIRNSGAGRNLSTGFRRERSWGIPINVVDRSQRTTRLEEIDQWIAPGRYPIPRAPRIQPSRDAHMLILQRGTCRLFELYGAHRVRGRWRARQATIWDTTKNQVLPPNVVSAVAAGTPMAAGLLNVQDARRSEITHALNFTLPYIQRSWVYPASHTDGAMTDPGYLPMGARIRLKASVSIERLPRQARIIATAMKRYGMILTDTSGRPDGDQYDGFEIQGSDSRRWNEAARRALYSLHLRDFEVVAHAGPIQHLDYTEIRHRRMLPGDPPWTIPGSTPGATRQERIRGSRR